MQGETNKREKGSEMMRVIFDRVAIQTICCEKALSIAKKKGSFNPKLGKERPTKKKDK